MRVQRNRAQLPAGPETRPGDRALRSDALRNYQRVLAAARAVFGESGADATIEEIAARADVGVGTVYRRFASKDALIDELVRVVMAALVEAAEAALARTDGRGLEQLLRAFGASFADHAHYANLLMTRPHDAAAGRRIGAAITELTTRAVRAGTIAPGITDADIMALVLAMRGLVYGNADTGPGAWHRFLDLHLAGLRAGPPAGDEQ